MSATWERIEVVQDDAGDIVEWFYLGADDDARYPFEFVVFDNAWSPINRIVEAAGAIGFMPRGAGNADTYVYLIRPDEHDDSEFEVALVDTGVAE